MSKTRWAVIGNGALGKHYAEIIDRLPETELVAAVNDDYGQILSMTGIDIVVVATPNYLHHRIGLDVLNAGKHLLIEKPFALSVQECQDLIAAAEKEQRFLAVGHQFRLSPLWGRIKQLIDEGFIGEPRYVLIELSRFPYRQGANGWRYDKNKVGNWILEEPIHFYDLAAWYLRDFGKPVSVYASANANNGSTLYDNLSSVVNFSNGSHAVIAQTLSAFEHHQTVKVAGTKGSLWASWSGAKDRTLTPSFFLKRSNGQEVVDETFETNAGELFELESQIKRMAEIINGTAPVHCTGQDGLLAVALSNAAQKSAETKELIIL
ncbi:MAG: Gfo/Idh/MocA family oxidoreductase [Planctomycetaceae bacterium]|jgi:myo-inositol 2-dehydrogenase/D-chiro-inositol 1-dehydrogenase|nr:Gfo/Idh/MocA family oxidoreductase [Planctomycetaceae bacterium]